MNTLKQIGQQLAEAPKRYNVNISTFGYYYNFEIPNTYLDLYCVKEADLTKKNYKAAVFFKKRKELGPITLSTRLLDTHYYPKDSEITLQIRIYPLRIEIWELFYEKHLGSW